MHTLLGHLAFRRFTPQVEDLATEALGYVLSRSEAARGAIKLHVARCGVVLPDQLSYETQSVGASEERPDLVGRTNQGEEPLLIEAKFWAGLTEHQPDTYLRRLPPGGALLFVVPEKRLHSVWNELLVRCDDAKVARMTREVTGNDLIAVALEDRKTLAITSWRRLLDDVHHATRDADEPQLAQDVVQLQGLCDQMDDEGAFLPIRDDELTSKHYRRILDFSRLPEDALNKLVASRTADRAGLKQGSGFGYRGSFFQLQGAGVLLAFSLNQWLKRGMTPIWLTVLGDKTASDRSDKKAAVQALESMRNTVPPKLFEDDKGFPTVPILLPVGEERDRVLASIVEQVDRIGSLIVDLPKKQRSGSASDSEQPGPTPSS